MRNAVLKLVFVIILNILLLNVSANDNLYYYEVQLTDHSDLTSEEHIAYLENRMFFTNVDDDKYDNGINYFGLFEGRDNAPLAPNNTYLTFMTMDGKIIHEPLAYNGRSLFQISWVNESTILADYEGKPLMWNILTNETQLFDFSSGQHHDMSYNPRTETFIVLEYDLYTIINQTGQPQEMLVDQITEYNLKGDVQWRWKVGDWQNLLNFTAYYQKLNETHTPIDMWSYEGVMYPDPTHANSLYWDMRVGEDSVYLNLRHFNQFIKIRRGTNVPIFIAGENTEYKLYDQNGNETDSLWYGAHDLSYLGNNQFIMFDNNFHNTTDFMANNDITGYLENETISNPILNYTQSSILVVEINDTDSSIHEKFRWKGPASWWTTIWGSARVLSNGNYLASFGAPVKGLKENPLNTTHGAVAVEVTPTGEIVWEMRLPYNWGAYRMLRIKPTTTVSPLGSRTVNVGEQVLLNFSDVFSNFPTSYRITLNGEEVESGDWSGESISYTVDTTGFPQGESFVSLYLMDQIGEEKATAVEIVVLYPRQSDDKKGPLLSALDVAVILVSIVMIHKKLKNSYRIN